ncbi:Mur ligase [Entophlyctis helioformis]|nr:Mur ligase [Entophlyctis helioformis]
MARDYATAIHLLNSLQTNAAILEAVRKQGSLLNTMSLPEFRGFVQRIGYKPSDLNSLAIIHVAGTKGKGSTSAFCESILRKTEIAGHNGLSRPLKTGLYTSPHLKEVRERIRINGSPVSKELFANHFFNVWDKLEATKASTLSQCPRQPTSSPTATQPAVVDRDHPDKPNYFRYLTLMSFHLFMQEKVDVVILETGVGGEYDCTNFIEKPVACGITSLGFDHMSILGETIDKIAWHKAGIIKVGLADAPIITAPQVPEAISVIRERAKERKASKLIEISDQDIKSLADIKLGLPGAHQRSNAAVARALCQEWIAARQAAGASVHATPDTIQAGLQDARWPGRCQHVRTPKFANIDWYIDGAHTPESLTVCAEWFRDVVTSSTTASATEPVYLVFNCTHGREGSRLFPPLIEMFKNVPLAGVVFCTNTPFEVMPTTESDMTNHTVMPDPELKAQASLRDTWTALTQGMDAFAGTRVDVAGSVEAAATLIDGREGAKRVLVTGSLHLLGSLLTYLDVDCS